MKGLHIHDWSKWTDPVQTYNSNKQQWRVCNHCNKAQFRTLWWDKQTPLASILAALKDLRNGIAPPASTQGEKS